MLWFAQVLLLLHIKTRTNDKRSDEFAFLRCFESTPSIDHVDLALNCFCLERPTEGGCEHPIFSNPEADDIFGVEE